MVRHNCMFLSFSVMYCMFSISGLSTKLITRQHPNWETNHIYHSIKELLLHWSKNTSSLKRSFSASPLFVNDLERIVHEGKRTDQHVSTWWKRYDSGGNLLWVKTMDRTLRCLSLIKLACQIFNIGNVEAETVITVWECTISPQSETNRPEVHVVYWWLVSRVT